MDRIKLLLTILVITLIITTIISIYSINEDYLLSFKNTPESFNCQFNENILEYGEKHFKKSNVIICGLARNIENNFEYFKNNIENITRLFGDYKILIVENDSIDNSRRLLLELKSKYNINILGCNQIDLETPCILGNKRLKGFKKNRIEKMVELRNIYMDYINSMDNSEYYNYVIVLDCDLKTTIYEDGLISTGYYFSKYPVDMIGCNGIKRQLLLNTYYDTYSLVYDNGKPSNIISLKNFNCNFKQKGDLSDLIRVKSGFCGMVVYNFNSIKGKRYRYEEDGDFAICEHVVFNKSLDNVYINPKMILPILSHD